MNKEQRDKLETRIARHDQKTDACSCPCDRCWSDHEALEVADCRASKESR